MLNRRFAGFELSEAEIEKGHDFVFKGLLVGEEKYWRAFRVIEEELVFVHDMYYTTTPISTKRVDTWLLCLPIIMFSLCLWLTLTCLPQLKTCTIIITVVLAFLELYQFYLYTASDLILRLKAFRPWKDRLGQYCLIRDLGHKSSFKNCLHYSTLCLVGQGHEWAQEFSEAVGNVKEPLLIPLLESNGHLTNGVTSLQNNSVHDLLSCACHVTTSMERVTRTNSVWHIATTLASIGWINKAEKKTQSKQPPLYQQYCMHLLAFAPNLLPDHNSISESILDKSITKHGSYSKRPRTRRWRAGVRYS
ncbi:hypothetical protein HU200_066513 [Digitaria exilis]|uniref:DUF4220 domain-containing protein n=1 Tax=Digitaria exilis TaxID=1010633 RepID=A0A835DWK9_9POAL|nr:hypothetical protein HU200_066513 [Digitaria exilis]